MKMPRQIVALRDKIWEVMLRSSNAGSARPEAHRKRNEANSARLLQARAAREPQHGDQAAGHDGQADGAAARAGDQSARAAGAAGAQGQPATHRKD